MRHGIAYVEDLPQVSYADLTRRLRGRRRLRRAGRAVVVFTGAWGERRVELLIVEHRAWRGGTRSYLLCPTCGVRALQILWNEQTEQAQCAKCWGPTRLRYRSQEQRRLGADRHNDKEVEMR